MNEELWEGVPRWGGFSCVWGLRLISLDMRQSFLEKKMEPTYGMGVNLSNHAAGVGEYQLSQGLLSLRVDDGMWPEI